VNKFFKCTGLVLFIILTPTYLQSVEDEVSEPPPTYGLPDSLSLVPYKKGGMIASINRSFPLVLKELLNSKWHITIGRWEMYVGALSFSLGDSRKKTPARMAQMALTDIGYEAVDGTCALSGIDFEKAPQIVQRATIHGTRLAAYALTQETAKRVYPDGVDPHYNQNMRVMLRDAGEDLAAEALWEGTKYTSKIIGLTVWLKEHGRKIAHVMEFDKCSPQAKELLAPAADFIGKGLIKGSVVRRASDKMLGPHPNPKFGFSINFEF